MPIIYNSQERIFVKQDFQKHSGGSPCGQESFAEAFFVNHFVDSSIYNGEIFEFNIPSYNTLGGTLNYYSQDFLSIFTNIYRPLIRFNFTANTSSFGTGTTIKHSVYKIPYDIYTKYNSDFVRQNIEGSKDSSQETIEETTFENDEEIKTSKISRKTTKTNSFEKIAPNIFPESINGYGFDNSKYNAITELLENPLFIITASTSAITNGVYDLFIDEYIKNLGDFKNQLFEDYGQYFVSTQIQFTKEKTDNLCDFCILGQNKSLISIASEDYTIESTNQFTHTITGGTFSGITVHGNHFTYFLIPNKPQWIRPYVEGQLTTFSPTFYWANTNDGDSFIMQVVYNSGDSQSFSGIVYTYPIKKEETLLSTEEMLNKSHEPWAITKKTTDIVREYSIPLLNKNQFWYRVGNVKEMINLFGVKQSVVTFSDIMSATTTFAPYNSFIYVQSDSPHVLDVPDWEFPPYLYDSLNRYSLSGTVYGSTVTGATIQLINSIGNYITQTTDLLGNFVFTDLESGNYTLNTTYRGYANDSRSLSISADTQINYKLKLLWGNDYDTWGKMANENYFL